MTPPQPPADVVSGPGPSHPFAFLCVRERRSCDAVVDVPAWFDDWFAETLPEPEKPAGYRGKEIATHLGLSPDAVYAALYDGRLEGLRATGRGWLVPRPAVRLWLLECAASNLLGFAPSGLWRVRKGLAD